jgi:cAMP phosphodiesterase
MNYNWHNDVIMFQHLVVSKPKKRDEIVNLIHEKIKHFSEQRNLVEIKIRYLWHNIIETIKRLIKKCK